MSELVDQLRHEILMARKRIYAVAPATPLERLELAPDGPSVFLKREDLTTIHAYKWRGAYNKMVTLPEETLRKGVAAASAGNHAQGVAVAARALGTRAHIFMPTSTPRMKQEAVRRHGGESVEIILTGNTYHEAQAAAKAAAAQHGYEYTHAFDDLKIMGGQGTLADEVVMAGIGEIDVAYLQIGGGGMAAAVSCWLKSYYPDIEIVGVEGRDQASMQAAIKARRPVPLEYVDVFCDGTAVSEAGALTHPLCEELVDRFVNVTNEEVCAAIQLLWDKQRCIPEPAGAMGLAGLMRERDALKGKRALVVVCGSNMDFGQLAWIARHAGFGDAQRHYLRFEISERSGSMLGLLTGYLDGLNIVDFQYGKSDMERAWPVIGFSATAAQMDALTRRLKKDDQSYEVINAEEDVDFRIIHYEADMMQNPFFILLEFHERAGALHDFLKNASKYANLCYFNYAYSGERVGRALIGFEFDTPETRDQFRSGLAKQGEGYRACREVSGTALERML